MSSIQSDWCESPSWSRHSPFVERCHERPSVLVDGDAYLATHRRAVAWRLGPFGTGLLGARHFAAIRLDVTPVDPEQRVALGVSEPAIGPARHFGRLVTELLGAADQPRLLEEDFRRHVQRVGDRLQYSNRWLVQSTFDLTQVRVRDFGHRRKLAQRQIRHLSLHPNET